MDRGFEPISPRRHADPWGNRIEVIDYADVQFTKAPEVQASMRLALHKSEKGMSA